MFSSAESAEMGGIVVHDFDVGNEAGPRVSAFDQIVTQNSVARETVLKDFLERFDLIDALPREDPFAKQVLIDIRDRSRVDIKARIP